MPGDTFRLVTLVLFSLVPVAMCISLIMKRSKQGYMTKEELINTLNDEGDVTIISPPDPLLLAACSLVPRKNSTIPPLQKNAEDER